MEAPEFFQQNNNNRFTDERPEHFIIEDLLDFSNDDIASLGAGDDTFDNLTNGNSTDSSTVTVVDSCNSSTFSPSQQQPSHFLPCGVAGNFTDSHFDSGLCVPYDDFAQLEWMTNFEEDSFSSDDLQKLQIISGMKARRDDQVSETQPETNRNNPIFASDVSVPGKARSKRSRAAPCNWSSRLLVLSPTTSSSESDIVSNSTGKKTLKAKLKHKEVSDNVNGNSSGGGGGGGGGDGRKCLHCQTDKTPQWRTGPYGPKTLCNACGVRFKSGRLVPEYRPAASPTFMLTQHSNSHRKVLELRRQKEMQKSHQHQHQYMHHNAMFNVSNGDDYLIHHHGGPDYRQLI